MPGSEMSSMYLALPVTLSRPSLRGRLCPISAIACAYQALKNMPACNMLLTLLAIAAPTLSAKVTLSEHKVPYIGRVVHSQNGAAFASCNNAELIVWDAASNKKQTLIAVTAPGALALSPDGSEVAVGIGGAIVMY